MCALLFCFPEPREYDTQSMPEVHSKYTEKVRCCHKTEICLNFQNLNITKRCFHYFSIFCFDLVTYLNCS